ncbi:MAG: hypothetical protein HY059_18175 [Proteobacteria bacterium]|nr:hypothetical protein [Pseudomonadota bacterium]
MRFIAAAFALLFLVAICFPADASPRDADCPLAHPNDPSLRFVGATLDQSRPGIPWPPDASKYEKQPGGLIYLITHYASYQILRDQVLICVYGRFQNRRGARVDHNTDIHIPMPGILMRCEGIRRDTRVPEIDDWTRRWCVHDPDK